MTLENPETPEINAPLDIAGCVAALSPKQKAAARALVSGATYPEMAAGLGMHLGTLHTHLRRVRERFPDLYGCLLEIRRDRLDERHQAALRRAESRSREYLRQKAARAYYAKAGRWPWERWQRR